MQEVVDLFAGAGGLDLGARELGLDPLGIEWDDAACAVREAAGLRTLHADVAALDPHVVLLQHFNGAYKPNGVRLSGLIGGPPCPAFSSAGKGEGRDAMPFYTGAIERMGRGEQIDRAEMDKACGDERAHLVLEPLRWALALMPRWIVLEQVPPVLPLWEAMCAVLRSRGYSATCAVLSAEQFGVPQTRKRAFLIASLDGPVSMPAPTHRRYIAPRRRDEDADALFAAPEPERIVAPEDRGLLPWVSMAQALGWDREDRIGFPRRNDTGSADEYRERDLRPADEPRFALTEKVRSTLRFRAGTNANDATRAADEPAPTLRFGARLNDVSWVSNAQDNAATRGADEPAPTITGVHDHNERRWVVDTGNTCGGTRKEGRARAAGAPAPAITSRADQLEWRDEEPDTTPYPSPCGCPWDYIDADGFCACCHAHLDDPAGLYAEQGDGTHGLRGCPRFVVPTHYDRRPAPPVLGSRRSEDGLLVGKQMAPGEGRSVGGHGWVDMRPATTVNGDPRISEPGHDDSEVSGSQQANAVRVTLEEAAALQSFPPSYPWMAAGSRTAAFQCVGNAVPPLLAWHVLRAVVPAASENVA